MKKNLIIIALLLVSITSFSQSWFYEEKQTDFDGFMKAAYVVGTGEFPYSEPLLFVRDAGGEIDIALTGTVGSYGNNLYIKVKFSGESDVLVYSVIKSDSDYWIFDMDIGQRKLFLNKLKVNSTISVRLCSENGSDDYKFTLYGSTKAISKVGL